jgi:DNA-binding response OmpR family regulator
MKDKTSRYIHHGQSEKQEVDVTAPDIQTLLAVPDKSGFMTSVFLERTTELDRLVGPMDVLTFPHTVNGRPGSPYTALATIVRTLREGTETFTVYDLISEEGVLWSNAHQARIVNQVLDGFRRITDQQLFSRVMRSGENEYRFLGGMRLIDLRYPQLARWQERRLSKREVKYKEYLSMCNLDAYTQVEQLTHHSVYPPSNQRRDLKTISQEIIGLSSGEPISVPKMVDALNEESYARVRHARIASMMRVLELAGHVKAVGIGSDMYVRTNSGGDIRVRTKAQSLSDGSLEAHEARLSWPIDPKTTPKILISELGMTITTKNRMVQGKAMPVWLGSKEFELLTLLAVSPNQVMTEREILQSLYGAKGTDKHLAQIVRNLRKKIAQADLPKSIIETVRKDRSGKREGYRLTTTPDLYMGNGTYMEQ